MKNDSSEAFIKDATEAALILLAVALMAWLGWVLADKQVFAPDYLKYDNLESTTGSME